MKKSRFTDQQIAFALQQAEAGTPVAEVCRKMGISEPSRELDLWAYAKGVTLDFSRPGKPTDTDVVE